MKTKIIYHQTLPKTDCPDGIAAAWVAHKAHPDADIEGCSYAYEKLPEVEGYKIIIIVDFSFPKDVLERWANNTEVIVIDHHKTAMADLSTLSDRILQRFDMSECGATLTWKFFFPNQQVPAFLEYVRDRDLWNFELENSEEMHEAIASLRYQSMPGVDKLAHVFEVFNMLEKMSAVELNLVFAPWGYQLLKPKRQRIAELAELAESRRWSGSYITTVEVPESEGRLVSDLCSYLYKQYPQFDYVAAYIIKENQIDLSFRSNKNGNNFDVSAIAKKLGGGGHHNAAGAVVKNLPWLSDDISTVTT